MDGSTVRPVATHIREMLTMLEKASACTDDSRVSKSHLVKKKKERKRIFLDTAFPLILSVMMELSHSDKSQLSYGDQNVSKRLTAASSQLI